MHYILHILQSIVEPFTKPEMYQKLISNLIMIVIYVVVAWVVIRILNKIIEKFFKVQNKGRSGNKKRSKTLVSLVKNIVSYVIWFIVLTTILSKFGISVEGIIASAGVVGLAVGFGAQTLVKDVITGFFIIFENQFDVGDYVKINNGGSTVAEGTVESIGLRSTRIHTVTGELTVLPNGSMGEINNFSVTNGNASVEIPIAVDEDVDHVERILNQHLATLPSHYFLFESTPKVLGINAISRDEIVLGIAAETKPGESASVSRILRKEILNFLKVKGIKTPPPVMVQYDRNKQGGAD